MKEVEAVWIVPALSCMKKKEFIVFSCYFFILSYCSASLSQATI